MLQGGTQWERWDEAGELGSGTQGLEGQVKEFVLYQKIAEEPLKGTENKGGWMKLRVIMLSSAAEGEGHPHNSREETHKVVWLDGGQDWMEVEIHWG